MAFGSLKGTLSGNGPSIGTSNAITGSVAVVAGDLVFVAFMQQTNLTATAATDNLGNTYSATNVGSDPGSLTGRAFWSLVTNAGTLTGISVAATSSTQDYVGVAAVIEGVFASSPLDANPANIVNDLTSPFVCPATGTLSQADEVIMSWAAYQGGGDDWAADSPNLKAIRTQESNRSAIIGYQLVSSTSSVAPAFSHANATGIDVLGTSSFKKASLNAVFTGTVTATFSQTGAFGSRSALAGTTPIVFDQSGDFVGGSATGDANFTGTITTAFSQTGALAATSIHAGTAAFAFSQVGAFSGGFTAAGATTLIFAQTGAFAARGAFAATTTITFGQTGALRGSSAQSGTATAIFSQAGALKGGSTWAGTSPIIFGQTGALASRSAFGGTLPIVFSLSSAFSLSGSVFLDPSVRPGAHLSPSISTGARLSGSIRIGSHMRPSASVGSRLDNSISTGAYLVPRVER